MFSTTSVLLQTCWFYGLYYLCDFFSVRKRPSFDAGFTVVIHFNYLTLMALTWYHSSLYGHDKVETPVLVYL